MLVTKRKRSQRAATTVGSRAAQAASGVSDGRVVEVAAGDNVHIPDTTPKQPENEAPDNTLWRYLRLEKDYAKVHLKRARRKKLRRLGHYKRIGLCGVVVNSEHGYIAVDEHGRTIQPNVNSCRSKACPRCGAISAMIEAKRVQDVIIEFQARHEETQVLYIVVTRRHPPAT